MTDKLFHISVTRPGDSFRYYDVSSPCIQDALHCAMEHYVNEEDINPGDEVHVGVIPCTDEPLHRKWANEILNG